MKSKHKQVIMELGKEFAPLMENSPDGVYLWLDEENMICNKRLADMFGYTIKEMCSQSSFLDSFVAEKDQKLFSMNYHKSIAPLASPVRFKFHGIKKDGSTFLTETDMIPISFKGHAIAYHFVRKIKN